MTYPSSDVNTTNADAGTDVPATFRSDVLDLIQKFNLLRNWIPTFAQGLINSISAAAARGTLGSSTVGDAVFVAANAGAARSALGVTEPLGIGQAWTDVKAIRAVNSNYSNGLSRSIEVSIGVQTTASGASAILYVGANPVYTGYQATGSAAYFTVTATIPPGQSYQMSVTNCILANWMELK